MSSPCEGQAEAYRYLIGVRDVDPEQRAKCAVWRPGITQEEMDRTAALMTTSLPKEAP